MSGVHSIDKIMIHHSIPLRAQHEMCGVRSLNFPCVSQKGGCESLQPSSLANSMLVGSSIPVPTDRINDCVWCCAPAMRGSIGPIPTTHTPFPTPQSTLAYQKVTHTSRNRQRSLHFTTQTHTICFPIYARQFPDSSPVAGQTTRRCSVSHPHLPVYTLAGAQFESRGVL
jgi:hypothetical protein